MRNKLWTCGRTKLLKRENHLELLFPLCVLWCMMGCFISVTSLNVAGGLKRENDRMAGIDLHIPALRIWCLMGCFLII
jgi:hypothetical protein